MGSILVVAELQKGKLRDTTFELVSLARKVAEATGRDVRSVVLGQGVADAGKDLAGRGGGTVYTADHELLAQYNSGAFLKALRAAVEAASAEVVLFSHTPIGWDVAPRLAAALDGAFVSDCVAVEGEDGKVVLTRRIFNGKLDARMVPDATPVIATVQPGATGAYEGGGEGGEVSPLDVSLSADELRSKWVEVKAAEQKGVDLSKAEIVVSGGRGVGAPEKFEEVIAPLAEALGGAMGASRPVVDAGWLPHERQVGSSGQTVTPKLYIAVGISGAIQHLVGMKASNFIIAINKDPDAPIFEVADIGVPADLFEVVPALTAAVKEAKGK